LKSSSNDCQAVWVTDKKQSEFGMMESRQLSGSPLWIAKTVAVVVFFTGIVVLSGWAFNISPLKSILPNLAKMAPVTALCFTLAGATLWVTIIGTVRRQQRPEYFRHWLPKMGAAIIALIGLIRIITYLFRWNLDLDYLFLHEVITANPARMSPATAFDFVLAGIALLLTQARWLKTFQFLVLLGGFVGWLGFNRFLFGGEALFLFQQMAIHTSAAFLLLNIGILCLRTDGGLMALLLANNAGGQTLRRLLLPILLLLLLENWTELEVGRAGWLSAGATKSLFMGLDTLIFGALIWFNAGLLNHADIRRRLTEENFRKSQERIRAIVECSDDAIISKTLDGVITTWNQGAEKLFGYSAREAINRPMPMLFPSDRANEETEILKKIVRGEIVSHFETVRVRKDGTSVDVSVTLSPLKDSEGNIIGASKIARDITERKRAAAKLQAQFARLNLLNQITRAIGEHQDLQSIYQVVIRSLEDHLPIDFGCVCLYDSAANTLTVTRIGIKSEALATELALPEQSRIQVDQNGLLRCVQGELVYEPDISQTKFSFPERLARGGLRALVITPLLVESKVFGVLIVARREPNSFDSSDCEFLRQLSEHTVLATHQAQLHEALQTAYNDLRQTQQAVMQQERLRALGEMASGVAHDINNSLSPVMLYIGLLLEKETNISPASRSHLETVQRAVSDVAETIARLKEFYRQREPQLTLAPLNLSELARQVVELTRARWNDVPQQHGLVIQMQTELAPGLPNIMGAESEIREALINLIFNAVDAMPKGGSVTLRTKTSGKNVSVEVADTGTGMDEETRRHCLEPFFTTKGEHGTGLGLAMVYGIVQRHSADLEIESEPGRGTTIRMIFPSAIDAASSNKPSGKISMLPRLRLLVVDDDPLLIKALRDILEADGHVVVTTNGGQSGIDVFQASCKRNEPFAAVITDLGMPYVDGRAVAKAVKTASPTTPVILLTGWGKRLASENDIPPHVNYVLSKPPKPSELREALAQCVS
jgi:PAS domain S-box-containing protein